MDPALTIALNQPDFDRVMLLAVSHADVRMRKYIWRGHRPKASSSELMVDGRTAADFVNEALRRLCDGTRTYNPDRSLQENLNSITDSIISSAKKTSDRTGVVDFAAEQAGHHAPQSDPISAAISAEAPADHKLLADEVVSDQQKCFQMLRASFDGDKQMQEYLDALNSGYFDLAEIEAVTGIPVSEIYELRRKLKKYAPQFFGVQNYQKLERIIQEG